MSRFRRLRGLLRARVIHASTGGRRLRMELLERRWLFAVDAAAPHDPILGADVVLPAAMGAGAISGIKWSDANGDGNQDPNEPGLPGVTIYLDANGNGTLNDDEQSTVTGQGGAYSFTNLMAGTYVVREVIPAGYAQTFPLQPASNFDIRIVFPDNTLTQEQKDVFTQAAARWEQIIIGDLPAVNLPGFGLVDDLVIEASAPEIDGPGKVLGQAGPRFIRNGSFLPISGEMQFDIDDVEELIEEGQFDEVILHEMGHVLGIGTIWDLLDLLEGDGTPNPSFTGTRATAEYNAIFGANAAGVPVEGNQGGSGTLYAHWDEEALDNELMTGFLNPNQFNPLSRITAASMADLGYQVYLNAADSYSEPSLALLAAPLRPRVEGWVAALDLPLVAVDATEPPAVTLPELSTADFGFWNVTLDDGEMVTAVDFGNRPLPSSIRGRKFNDRNNDGERSAGEPGLEGWTIFLDADGDETLDPGERS
ncbi:MAG TPA: SdrD B-like domain-containing protein, partial [Lacipirellulaceae bacterium]|nr:SdrD B-like domain-containing protein [Lacipirellulaceae bacterium]